MLTDERISEIEATCSQCEHGDPVARAQLYGMAEIYIRELLDDRRELVAEIAVLREGE